MDETTDADAEGCPGDEYEDYYDGEFYDDPEAYGDGNENENRTGVRANKSLGLEG
jgi:hypothetical protein